MSRSVWRLPRRYLRVLQLTGTPFFLVNEFYRDVSRTGDDETPIQCTTMHVFIDFYAAMAIGCPAILAKVGSHDPWAQCVFSGIDPH